MILFLVLAILVVVIIFITKVIIPFKQEKDYIVIEMDRAETEKEFLFWQRQLKNLYIGSYAKRKPKKTKEKK